MKIFVLSDLTDCNVPAPAYYLLADSALVTHKKPLFLPDWDEEFRCVPAVAFRIGKLGKSIAPRFASRYIDGVTPAFTVHAVSLLQELQHQGLPLTEALSFDGAAAVGEFGNPKNIVSDNAEIEVEFSVSDCESVCYIQRIGERTAEMLARISSRNQMRTGDMLILPLAVPSFPLRLGMNISSKLITGEQPVSELVCRIR